MVVPFTSRLSAAATPLKHAWEHTVGGGRALLALRADWQEQLQRCHDELGLRHVRFHALLTDDMGTLTLTRTNPSRISTRTASGMSCCRSACDPSSSWASWRRCWPQVTRPSPADYDAWATLIRKLVGHWVDRYGVAEVAQSFFEVWNEPQPPAPRGGDSPWSGDGWHHQMPRAPRGASGASRGVGRALPRRSQLYDPLRRRALVTAPGRGGR